MIRYVIICKDYKKGNQCAKHVSHTLEQGYPEGDVLILRLKDGKEKAWSFELDPGVRTIVTNDISSKDTKALSELEVWIESRKRKNITR